MKILLRGEESEDNVALLEDAFPRLGRGRRSTTMVGMRRFMSSPASLRFSWRIGSWPSGPARSRSLRGAFTTLSRTSARPPPPICCSALLPDSSATLT
jgi:hypothetical protein